MDQITFPIESRAAQHLQRIMDRLSPDAATYFVGISAMIDQAHSVLGARAARARDLVLSFDADGDGAVRDAVAPYLSVPTDSVFLLLPANYVQFIYINRGFADLRRRDYTCLFVTGRDYFTSEDNLDGAGRVGRPQMFALAGQYVAAQGFNFVHGGMLDFYEFGCFDGASMSLAHSAFSRILPSIRYVGFDTFTGITGGMVGEEAFPEGDWAANYKSFVFNMKLLGVPEDKLIICPGDITRTVANPAAVTSQLGLRRCAAAHIDCDVYEPTKSALYLLKENMVSGGLVLFDDWDTMDASDSVGERRAAAEFLEENSDIRLDPYENYALHGRAFIYKRLSHPKW